MESCKTLHKYFEIFIFVDSGFSIFAFLKKYHNQFEKFEWQLPSSVSQRQLLFYFLFHQYFPLSVLGDKIFETNQLKKAHGRFTTMTKISMDVL